MEKMPNLALIIAKGLTKKKMDKGEDQEKEMSSDEMEEGDEGSEEKSAIAEEILSAIKSDDVEGLVSALQSFVQSCQS